MPPARSRPERTGASRARSRDASWTAATKLTKGAIGSSPIAMTRAMMAIGSTGRKISA